MRRRGWPCCRALEREWARASSRMEGRSAVRRREEKKPRVEEDGSREGGWKRPRGSEREDGWEREQWPEPEMVSAGEGGAASRSS
nr:unnamed protein product [Digitaria exilis]